MMRIDAFAGEICAYLKTFPEVKQCGLYGSLQKGNSDRYSDIDIELDVTGNDNGKFLLKLPELLSKRYQLIFYDFAPSLAPEQYVVTVAIDQENPFMLVDISCTASKVCGTVSKEELRRQNNPFDHTLKLFTANLKHYIRGMDCLDDIFKMFHRIFPKTEVSSDEKRMLEDIYFWLVRNGEKRHKTYLDAFQTYLDSGAFDIFR